MIASAAVAVAVVDVAVAAVAAGSLIVADAADVAAAHTSPYDSKIAALR